MISLSPPTICNSASLIIHGRLVCESSSPILALCLCDHTRVNKPETKLHRLTLSSFPIFTQKIIT
ncbi:hypothetical protein GFK34_20790 [Salmonella enterica subsp. enterica serovar Typhimurium]|nr:hypothetical protein [Salmonella enterica subsp. enterica serovar Typhimurium]